MSHNSPNYKKNEESYEPYIYKQFYQNNGRAFNGLTYNGGSSFYANLYGSLSSSTGNYSVGGSSPSFESGIMSSFGTPG